MAGARKKGDYSVLSEINSGDEWNTLCQRKGLTVVDVYSEWSGPCSAMTNFLKKIKLEVNDDLLQYAMAKADTIPQLHIFKGHCKPIWLFMASGDLVAVMHGANAPLLQKMIEKEMKKERLVLMGEATREPIQMEHALPAAAHSRSKSHLNLWADTDEEEEEDDEDDDDDVARDSKNFAILLVQPFITDSEELNLTLKDSLADEGFDVIKETAIAMTHDDLRMFMSGQQFTEKQSEAIRDALLSVSCRALLLRCDEGINAIHKLTSLIGSLDTSDASTSGSSLRKTLCSAPEGSPQPFGLLCPDRQGFMDLMEKHFMRALTTSIDHGFDDRKIMTIFLEEQQEFVMNELKECDVDILGKVVSILNQDKAKMIMTNRRNRQMSPEVEHNTFIELCHSQILVLVLRRETSSAGRNKQDAMLSELQPMIVSMHLASMSIFFTNIVVDRYADDGKYLGPLEQLDSDPEDPPHAECP